MFAPKRNRRALSMAAKPFILTIDGDWRFCYLREILNELNERMGRSVKNVLIIVIGNTGNESEVLRQSLERFGYFVAVKYIGRPNDFISVISGDLRFESDYIILSCHGEDGKIVMPILDETIYELNEPVGNMSACDIEKRLNLHDKVILNLGCTTGTKDLAKVFSKENTYIAPNNYVEGNAALYFVISFFYELSKDTMPLQDAYNTAKAHDEETRLFQLFQ